MEYSRGEIMSQTTAVSKPLARNTEETSYKILVIIGLCHLLNDSIQSVVPAMFPIFKESMGLTFTQLGFITFSLQIVSSILQPLVGFYTDKKKKPFALPFGLSISLIGVIGLALSPSYLLIILSVLLVGFGSAVFHPEGSRVAYMAAGNRRGLAQSIYQVGGNSGQALGPLITAFILLPFGQKGALSFVGVAVLAIGLLLYIAYWYSNKMKNPMMSTKKAGNKRESVIDKKTITSGLILILFFIFARSWYTSGITNFYMFYAIKEYGISKEVAQLFIFAFLVSGAVGTFFGGPLADRFGKKMVIATSMLATAPLSILIPFVPKIAAFGLLALSGFLLMSSFSVTVVYAQELVPGKIGTMAGLTVGLAFGMGAIGSIGLGSLADVIGISPMIKLVGFLPLLGICALFLPSDKLLTKG